MIVLRQGSDGSVFPAASGHGEDADMKQSAVIRDLGIQQTVYSGYERGARTIPLEHLIKMSDLYDVSPDFLTGRIRNMKVNK